MRLAQLLRLGSPELFFGVFHTLVWLLLVLGISAGVVGPLAEAFSTSLPLAATLQ
jgi:hypothetical protein